MSKNLVISLVFILMTFSGFLALRTHPVPDADFRLVIGDSMSSLDPAIIQWNEEIRMALSVWEGLTSYHPETTAPVEGCAKFPPQISADGITYTFEIKEAARWSNSDPVTADDFIYAWRRAMEPGIAGNYVKFITEHIAGAHDYNNWRNIGVRVLILLEDLSEGKTLEPDDQQFLDEQFPEGLPKEKAELKTFAADYRTKHLAQVEDRFDQVGLRADGPRRLIIQLTRPTAYFLDLTSFSTFLPVHKASISLLTEFDDLAMWRTDPQWIKPDYHANGYPGLISNGAYQMKDWQFKRFLFFQRNPHYWDYHSVPTDRILARMYKEPSTAFLAYEKGLVDYYRDLSRLDFVPALYQMKRAKQRNDLHFVNGFGTYFYLYNCLESLTDGSPNPFHDARIRMAFNLAVDKQAICDKVKKIGNNPAYNLVPPDSIAGYSCPPGPQMNIEHAKQLLSEAGFPNGEGLPTVIVLYNSGYGHEYVAQAIVEMWRTNLNVNARTLGKELKSVDEDKKTQQFMICRMGWFGDYGDPSTFLDMLKTGNGNNNGRFSYAPYDALLDQAEACIDSQERFAILSQAEQMIMHEQMPILPIYYYNMLSATKPYVKGLTPNPREMNPWKYVSVER